MASVQRPNVGFRNKLVALGQGIHEEEQTLVSRWHNRGKTKTVGSSHRRRRVTCLELSAARRLQRVHQRGKEDRRRQARPGSQSKERTRSS